MTKTQYKVFEALNPFFEIVMEGLSALVDGDHYFDTIAENAVFEFRYIFPGWRTELTGRKHECPCMRAMVKILCCTAQMRLLYIKCKILGL